MEPRLTLQSTNYRSRCVSM